ncbi:ABC transporter permease [Burkholderia ambifaria]|uniref:Binding-protein-dependent transport systems inner membrane component n=1 Tax=Burkholderia ambifaria MEX-5 TaxID=396597 RepID=B1SXV0_9BURK|nr:ABC transporter permease [Burkholderia ambifaria]EDT43859.1 binding-protein-dependent transport systems inner membrane component [Burkholderia ambifaria MEX-5]
MNVISRLLSSALLLVVVSALLFAMCRATPVSPARLTLGSDATIDQIAAFNHQYGLDRPVPEQYGHWLANAVALDFGTSYVSGSAIGPQIGETLPVTVELVSLSFAFTLIVSIVLGTVAALKENGAADHLLRVIAIVGLSVPSFWLGLLLIRYVALKTGWFPVGGLTSWSGSGLAHIQSLTLPMLTMSVYYISVLSRLVRTSMVDALSQEYVRTARALGLPRARIRVYALKNALPPLVSTAAMSYGYMFGWALIVEQIFNIPGVSRALLAAIFQRDYPTVQAIVLVITAIFILSNTCADLLHGYLDPKANRK